MTETESIPLLQRLQQELAALTLLAAGWRGKDRQQIAEGLVRELAGVLPATFVYARLTGAAGDTEAGRTVRGVLPPAAIRELGRALEPVLQSSAAEVTATIGNPLGPGGIRLAVLRLGCEGDCGVIAAGSTEPGFPGESELLLLRVAANQAAMVLERLQGEERRRQGERAWLDFFEGAAVAIHLVGPDGTILRANRAELELLGYSAEEYIGQSVKNFHADERAIGEILQQLHAGEELRDREAQLRCKDGSIKHVLISSNVLWENGRFIHTRCFTRDISDRKRAETELQKQNKLLATLVESIPDIVSRLDRDLRFLYISPAVSGVTGRPSQEYIGKPRTNQGLSPEHARIREELSRKVFETGEEQQAELPIQTAEGERVLEWRFIPERGADGSVESLMTLTRDVTERRKAEEALRESERRFRTFADTAPAMLWVTEPDGSCSFRSRGWYEFTGQTEASALGAGWLDAVHPGERLAAEQAFHAARAGRDPFALEYRLRRRDGEYRWALDAGRPRFGRDGEFLGYIGSVIDISARKQAEALFRELVERAPYGIYIVDSRFRISHMNSASQTGTFRNIRPAIGRDLAEVMRILWPEPVAEEVVAAFRRTLETGDPYRSKDFVNPRSDIDAVEAYEWEVHRITLADGQYGAICYYFDSTRLREAEQSVRQSEARYRSLTEAITSVVWTTDALGRFEQPQPAWSEYTGQTEEEVRGFGWMNAIHPDDRERIASLWEEARSRGRLYEAQGRVRHAASGEYRRVQARATPVLNEDGSVREWVGACTDVEDQRRAEEQLQERQKLESIGLLAGGIAHDFNNLLTGIMGSASLAAEVVAEDHPARELMDEVVQASESAAHLTRQLLAYAGKGRFFLKPLDLSELLREMASLLQSSISRTVQLQLDLGVSLPAIEGDANQIRQLIMSLVLNGAEAIGEQNTGTVRMRTWVQTVDEFWIVQSRCRPAIQPGRYVVLEVTDSGCGMDDQMVTRIFDPFFTTKFVGRGLGLAAALGIVQSHHGAIRVSSSPGTGSTFQVLLPAGRAEAPADLFGVPEAAEKSAGTGTILVVDDEEPVRRLARTALTRSGYTVLMASNGREAVEVFRTVADEISLVLLDLTMPVLAGEQALELLRAIRPDVPVLLSSGYNEAEVVRRFHAKELAGFIQKPYTAAALMEKVRKCAKKREASPGGSG